MAFNLEITLTGICAFVKHTHPEGQRFCVVMPSTETDRNAVDDEPLCPHECSVEQGYGFALVKVPLVRKRLVFNDFPKENNPALTALPTATHDRLGLIDITDSGFNHNTNPAVVSENPPDYVMAQVFLERGYPYMIPADSLWTLNPNNPISLHVAHEVKIELR